MSLRKEYNDNELYKLFIFKIVTNKILYLNTDIKTCKISNIDNKLYKFLQTIHTK